MGKTVRSDFGAKLSFPGAAGARILRRVTTNLSSVQRQELAAAALPTAAPAVADKAFDWRLILALGSVYVIWSSTYLGMKFALGTFPPMVLGTLRFLTAGGILMTVHLVRGGRLPTRRELLAALPVGVLLFVGGNGFVAIAQHEVASGVAAIVASTTPLWAALLGPIFGERTRSAEWIGVALGTGGVALLASHSDLGSNWGMTVVLLAAPVTWALGSLLVRRTAQPPGLAGPATHMLAGGLGMLLMSSLMDETWPSAVSGETIAVLVYLVVFGSLVAFTAFNWLLRNTRPSLALSYSYVNPAIAVLLGVVVGHEPLHETTIAATAMLALAVGIVIRGAMARRGR